MRRGAGVVVAGGLLAAVAALAAPAAPPLYDGVEAPDEPYRATGTTSGPAPTVAREDVPVRRGRNRDTTVATAETGPQAAVRFVAGSLAAPGSTRITAVVEPVAPTSSPRDGTLLSNAYRISVTADAGQVELVAGARRPVVQLRIPTAVDAPVSIELRTEDWYTLSTKRVGVDVYEAELPALGEVAAVQVSDRGASRAYAAAGSGRTQLYVLLGAVVVLAVAAALLGLRALGRAQQRQAELQPRPPGSPPGPDQGREGDGA